MSNWTPDDPIGKPSACKNGRFAATNINAPVGTVVVTDQTPATGVFDYQSLFDPSGQEHILYGEYDVSNNNIVHCCYRIVHLDGTVTERLFILGGATVITSPDYVKVDGCSFSHKKDIVRISLTGHKISEAPGNNVRKMGQVRGHIDIPAAWMVFAPFSGQWTDMSGDVKRWAEELASYGAMSGKSTTHFGAEDNEIRSHIAKIVAMSVEHVG